MKISSTSFCLLIFLWEMESFKSYRRFLLDGYVGLLLTKTTAFSLLSLSATAIQYYVAALRLNFSADRAQILNSLSFLFPTNPFLGKFVMSTFSSFLISAHIPIDFNIWLFPSLLTFRDNLTPGELPLAGRRFSDDIRSITKMLSFFCQNISLGQPCCYACCFGIQNMLKVYSNSYFSSFVFFPSPFAHMTV